MNEYPHREKDSRYFRISNFYASAFLYAKGLELVNIDRADPKRSKFVFRDIPQRQQWLQAFNFATEDSPEAMIDARKLIMAVKMLKDKLYQQE